MELRVRAIEGVELRCALCHDALGALRWRCERCGSLAHEECAAELSCPTLGCVTARRSPRADPHAPTGGRPTDGRRSLRLFMIAAVLFMSLMFAIVIVFAEGSAAVAPFMHGVF